MAKANTKESSSSQKSQRQIRPALTPEANEQLMVSLAMDCAMQQLRDGTASSQVITHFLKIGSTMGKEELARLKSENELLKAKTDSIKSADDKNKMYAEAIRAMKVYSGSGESIEDEEDEDEDY